MLSLALLLQDTPDTAAVQHIALGILAILPVLIAIAMIIVILPCWFICKKAGFSPWLSLLNFVPFGSLILLYVLAFSDWKVIPTPQMGWQQPPYPQQPPVPPQV